VRSAAVEPESELVKVVIEMLIAHNSLISSQQPHFQERSDSTYAGQGNVRRVTASDDHDLLFRVPMLRGAVIAFPAGRVSRGLPYHTYRLK
jgi:hypothetical protein